MTAKNRMGVPRKINETVQQCGQKNVGSQSTEQTKLALLAELSGCPLFGFGVKYLPGSERRAYGAVKVCAWLAATPGAWPDTLLSSTSAILRATSSAVIRT
jgi:hypothetical protein